MVEKQYLKAEAVPSAVSVSMKKVQIRKFPAVSADLGNKCKARNNNNNQKQLSCNHTEETEKNVRCNCMMEILTGDL